MDHPTLLDKKFGPETINYYAGSPLNRFSFLRTSHTFLSSSLLHPAARFLLLHSLNPSTNKESGELCYVTYDEIKHVLGGNRFEKTDDERVEGWSEGQREVTLVFVGCDERVKEDGNKEDRGVPYWVVDVTPAQLPNPADAEKITTLLAEKYNAEYRNIRLGTALEKGEAAIVAQARSFVDWNARNQFCAGCGGRTMSVWAGAKRVCPPTSLDPAELNKPAVERPACISRKGLHNFAYPRTDASVIMAVISPEGDKILLGRNKKWPKGFYSTLAGFLEPGESIEEAVRREVYEESGIICGRVQFHSSQPWPFPANIMIGCIAEALPTSTTVDLGNDPELEDARWFTREEVQTALESATFGIFDGVEEEWKGGLRVPPDSAIAHKLMASWARDDWGLTKL
ncbi:hypothetical protein SAICODRAFT_57814 [Saitoella complicata NRRL Y-17804]|nr:uncharacterized protein SAICODRAFT_57814 [Saitoella complicata NRRL Y-17804]ODQ52618.1 hypothetical protein SAICODRAFT_57814 [Saitoella complicata NRRL Y-17804]